MRIHFTFLSAFLFLSACAHTQPNVPKKVSVGDSASAYDRALRALVDAGYEVATKDRDAGVVQSAWRDMTTATARAISATVSLRERVVVTIADGTATVRLEQQTCHKASIVEQGPGSCQTFDRMTDETAARLKRIAAGIAAPASAPPAPSASQEEPPQTEGESEPPTG